MGVKVSFGFPVQGIAEVIVDRVCHLVINFSTERSLSVTPRAHILSLGVVHCAVNWVVFGFDRHHKLSAFMLINCKDPEELVDRWPLFIGF